MRLLCMSFPPNKRAVEATEAEQAEKMDEEYHEWSNAYYCGIGDPIEEAIDSMLATDNWLDKQPEDKVKRAVTKVLSKGVERGD